MWRLRLGVHPMTPRVSPAALPADGQMIRWRRRGESAWKEGRVARVWAMDPSDPVIRVQYERWADSLDDVNLFPSLGDEWEPPNA